MRVKKARSPARRAHGIVVTIHELQRQQSLLGADADAPLRLGADALNANAERVAKELRAAVDDPDSPFHREALELFVSSALPMAAINAAAVRFVRDGAPAVGVDDKETAPHFVLNVGLTYGPEQE